MVLALLGAAEGPLPTENQAGAVSGAGLRGSAGISYKAVSKRRKARAAFSSSPCRSRPWNVTVCFCLHCWAAEGLKVGPSQSHSYHSKRVPSRKGLYSLVWRGEDRDRGEHTPRRFLLLEDKLPHHSRSLLRKALSRKCFWLCQQCERPLYVCRAWGGANGFGFVLLGFCSLFMYLVKTPLSLTKKILSDFPSLLLHEKQVPTENQCQASTHGRDLGKLLAPPPWANQIVQFLPADNACMNDFMCLLLNYLSISWVS